MTRLTGLVAAALLLGSAASQAAPYTATGTGTSTAGDPIAASVSIDVSGSNLVIVLTDTSTTNTGYQPPDALLGIFFNMAPNLTLTPLSAALTSGSTVLGTIPAGNTLGDYWQYKFSSTGFTQTNSPFLSVPDKYGISATGIQLFGPGGNFGSNPTIPINGVDGAIVGTDYNDATANGGMTTSGHGPFEQDSITLTLSISSLPPGFDPSTAITDLSFIYGTAPDSLLTGSQCQNCVTQRDSTVPEPATLAMFAFGLLGLGGLLRLRKAAA
ncbi:MAG TPA: XDD4 family exosortase-dependent surface protein [Micropepsaceae bacterium]|nr:XDD4 family exosortase-dependent surface protein [Micropepsaceae bacterium]